MSAAPVAKPSTTYITPPLTSSLTGDTPAFDGNVQFNIAVALNKKVTNVPIDLSGMGAQTHSLANLIGYGCAIAVSYVGNARLTFRRPILLPDQFARFVVISLAALALNEGLVFVFTGPLHAPFYVALVPVVLVTPLLTFTLAKLWAFIER